VMTPAGKRIRVLVASSDSIYASCLGERLEKHGMEVRCYQAQQADSSELPDLSDIDVMVVETHGLKDDAWSLLEQVREQSPMIEILAICSDPEIESTVSAMRNGVFAILTYPVSDGPLAEAIQQAYQRKSAAEQRIKVLNGTTRPFG